MGGNMTPHRLFDWRSRLSAYVAACHPVPFAWGTHDCVLFASGAVEAMTGIDLAANVRGQYADRSGARRVLRNRDCKSLSDLVAKEFKEVPQALASDGDIAVFCNADRKMLGIVMGEMIAAPGQLRLEFVSRGEALAVFHVPFEGEVN